MKLIICILCLLATGSAINAQDKNTVVISRITAGEVKVGTQFMVTIYGSGFLPQESVVTMTGNESPCGTNPVTTHCRINNDVIEGEQGKTILARVPVFIGKSVKDLKLHVLNPDGSVSNGFLVSAIQKE